MGGLRALAVAAAAAMCLLLAGPAAAGTFDPRLKVSDFGVGLAPGDEVTVIGSHWFGFVSPNCDGKVRLELIDAEGTHHSLGRIGGWNRLEIVYFEDEGPGDMAGRVRIPNGVAPGPARIRGVQRLRLRIPPLACSQIQLARKSATATVTILGAIGNTPPRITDLTAPPIRQGIGVAITWSQSEAGTTTVGLEYEFVAGRWVDLGTIASLPTTAGANALMFDGSLEGHYLPPGAYRVTLEQAGDAGELSAPGRATFSIGYG